jgi:hypothetical protein
MLNDRKSIIDVLKKLRKELVCCYLGKDACDCKYGGGYISAQASRLWESKRRHETAEEQQAEEQTGCPELRTAIGVLERLTDEEYAKLSVRQPQPAITAYAVQVMTGSPDRTYTVGPFKTRDEANAYALTHLCATVIELRGYAR